MARTNATDVQAYLGAAYGLLPDGTAPDLTRPIRIANGLVTKVAVCATAKGITLTDDELEDLELLVACHLYQGSDEGYTSRSTSKASGSFKGQFTMGLERTTYGQDAMLADHSGCLAAINSKARAGGKWMGRPPSEQTDYVDRD